MSDGTLFVGATFNPNTDIEWHSGSEATVFITLDGERIEIGEYAEYRCMLYNLDGDIIEAMDSSPNDADGVFQFWLLRDGATVQKS